VDLAPKSSDPLALVAFAVSQPRTPETMPEYEQAWRRLRGPRRAPGSFVPSGVAATFEDVTSEEMILKAGELLVAAAPPRSRVILFGSQARAQAGVDSDLDFLVIEPEIERTAAESLRLRRALLAIPAAIDVVVMSEELAERRAKVRGSLVDRALREGRVIADS
jgi:uncharacterized protein